MNPLTTSATSAFDLPDHLSAKADRALIAGDEQHFAAIAQSLEQSIADLSDRLDAARKAPGGMGQQALDRDLEIHRLTARLRALLRRPGPRTPPLLHVGGLVFDVAARRLHHHDEELPLTHKEAELLELLMRRAGTVVRKSVITDALYGFDEEVTPNAIEALVSRLRHKIGASNGGGNGSSNGAPTLDTVRGMGYMLRAVPAETASGSQGDSPDALQ